MVLLSAIYHLRAMPFLLAHSVLAASLALFHDFHPCFRVLCLQNVRQVVYRRTTFPLPSGVHVSAVGGKVFAGKCMIS